MPDLGERGNVMGPQPIAAVVEPPAAMFAAAGTSADRDDARRRASAEAMTHGAGARRRSRRSRKRFSRAAYDKFEIIGRARVVEALFFEGAADRRGREPFKFQFRLGETGGKWTVREALNLTAAAGVERSGCDQVEE